MKVSDHFLNGHLYMLGENIEILKCIFFFFRYVLLTSNSTFNKFLTLYTQLNLIEVYPCCRNTVFANN